MQAGMWIVAIDIAGDIDVMFVPRCTWSELDRLPAHTPEFGEDGWYADDFANPAIYETVYTFYTTDWGM
jgi:hypothetical protein